jgi:hypothetical protein
MFDFKSVVYKHNIFGDFSLNVLPLLLQRRIPFHLEQLVISNCKITLSVSSRLVDLLTSKLNYIQKLGLVNINMSEKSLDFLA